MVTHSKRALLVNSFGTLGYFSCLLLWLWVAMQYLPLVTDNEQLMDFLVPPNNGPVITPQPAEPSTALTIAAFTITGIVMAVTLVFLLRLPVTIAKSGRTVTTKAAASLEPIITRGKPLPKQKRRLLTAKLVMLIKFLIILVPVLAGLSTIVIKLSLTYDIVLLVTAILSGASAFWFIAQYISAHILGVKPEQLV